MTAVKEFPPVGLGKPKIDLLKWIQLSVATVTDEWSAKLPGHCPKAGPSQEPNKLSNLKWSYCSMEIISSHPLLSFAIGCRMSYGNVT
ncbi:putative leucine-rich repeat receptor-like protein kinase [Frankliniella fusca]|uniref:Leucine-rich repeat receptor-like protein kinase n=1 Tax=Frankliniella fusca TaxID=407009 RepID=A0AAE1HC11_9NEOP|nr:putative leucine-rich repeat receptor-like protein kinase [Frankliniella fusca]